MACALHGVAAPHDNSLNVVALTWHVQHIHGMAYAAVLQVLDQVRLLLQPNAPSVVAELDKLNIYGPGGFFKPHFDTPRAGGGYLL